RFTIAHELGHHFLEHGERKRDTPSEFSASTFDFVEAAANRFAADLLMPATAVTWLVENKGYVSIEALAREFLVSEVAMRYRLKNLRLI
ncbi:MAG: ImmA/IrrE family metallo-endopeptidase, partial [Nevskia sp.]|nr:ImmA/IrrE family metallo-endopeptidase [Nevskia sp.]